MLRLPKNVELRGTIRWAERSKEQHFRKYGMENLFSVQVVAADVELNNHVGCGGINVGVASSETSASASGSGGWCADSAEDTRSPSLDRR